MSFDKTMVKATPDDQLAISNGYQWLLMGTLVLLNIVNMTDRSMIGILGQAIKTDLKISDTQFGFVSGTVFFCAYLGFSFPIARIADRGYRKAVIMASVLVWCLMTTLIGLSETFWQLVILRMGVALGEAGVAPATQALVYNQVSAHRRGLAMGMLLLGGAAGVALAPLIGGWAHDRVGWRGAFFVIGPVGLLLLPLLFFVIRNTQKRESAPANGAEAAAPEKQFSMLEAARYLVKLKSYRLLFLASAFLFVAPSAYMSYAGIFFIRTFSLSPGVAGQYLTFAFGFGSVLGVVVGGFAFDRFTKHAPGWRLAIPVLGSAAASVVAMVGWSSGSMTMVTGCFTVALFFGAWANAPIYVISQSLAPANCRSTAAAIFHLSSVLGGGLGPVLVGLISDKLAPSWGAESLRPALVAAAAVQLLGGLFMFRVALSFREDAKGKTA